MMTDWNALSHAYGDASAIPSLLDRLRTAPDDKAWQDLWSCLCHQGTVYSASYAALLPLYELAKALPPSDRLSPLMLIGKIIASDDLQGMEHRPANLIEPLLADLQTLAAESMSVRGLDPAEFVYYLEAASTFTGDLFWGRQLDQLVAGEFLGRCPVCRHDLHLVIGDYGFFTTAQEWARPQNAKVTRNPISPAEQQDLSGSGAWLHATAIGYSQPQIASWIRHVFGTAICPACDGTFKVAEAIALVFPAPQPTKR